MVRLILLSLMLTSCISVRPILSPEYAFEGAIVSLTVRY